MRKLIRISIIALLLGQFAAIGQAAENAALPDKIQFSGSLSAAAGPTGITFALYSEQTGGSALWLETQNVAVSDSGSYSMLLGSDTEGGIPQSIFSSGDARWLEVSYTTADGSLVTQPRVLLVSVPYAMKAGDAETLGGLPASAFMLQPAALKDRIERAGGLGISDGLPTAAVSGTGTTNRVTKWLDAVGTLGDSIIHDTGTLVGIGTATPGTTLDIQQDNAALILGGTGTHSLSLQGALSNGRFGQDSEGVFFASDTNGKVFKFLTNNGTLNEWMRIDNLGNVGIGTKLPVTTLDVEGPDAGLLLGGVGTHTLQIAGTASSVRLGQDSSGGFLFSDTVSKALRFGIQGFEAMRINSGIGSPFVGIGTAAPEASLHIEGQNSSIILSGSASVGHTVSFLGQTGANIGQDDHGMFLSSLTPNKSLRFLASSGSLNEWMRITGNGSVGIGTTAPGAKLDVQGSNASIIVGGSGTHSLSLQGSSSNGRLGQDAEGFFFCSDTSARPLRFLTNSGGLNEGMRIASTGEVGIGTSVPTQKLEVNGGTRLNTVSPKPACSSATRGTFWVTQAGAGVADSVEVCVKDAAEAYAWRTLL